MGTGQVKPESQEVGPAIELIIKPRLAPRGVVDAVFSFGMAGAVLLVIGGIPCALARYFTHSTPIALSVALGVYVAYVSFAVSHLVVTGQGLRFVRLLGSPRFLPWSSITAVVEVSRTEVAWHGWVWPPFPPREITPSMTSLGHYRIEYDGDWVYFPPKDAEAFELALSRRAVSPETPARPRGLNQIG